MVVVSLLVRVEETQASQASASATGGRKEARRACFMTFMMASLQSSHNTSHIELTVR
jgi:hypothetical protein